MGKKAKLKKIRKLASQLPVIPTQRVVGYYITGAEILTTSDQTEVDGKPIDPEAVYKKKEIQETVVNHHRRMKALYNKKGEAGVLAYVRAVDKYASEHAKAESAQQPAETETNESSK